MSPICIAICDDSLLYCELLSQYLSKDSAFHIVGTATSKEQLMLMMRAEKVDIVLLDIHLNDQDPLDRSGVELSIELKESFPDTKIIMLSSNEEPEIIAHCMMYGGAVNYLLKDYYCDLPCVMKDVYENRHNLHHSVAPKLIQYVSDSSRLEMQSRINEKQITILKMYDAGMDRRQIAQSLFTSEQVISNEINKISKLLKMKFRYFRFLRKKTDVKELIEAAKRLGLMA